MKSFFMILLVHLELLLQIQRYFFSFVLSDLICISLFLNNL